MALARQSWTPWRLASLAFAIDVAFVVVWWALVYRPGEQLFVAERAGAMRWGEEPVEEVRVLAPGSHALVRVGGAWHLLEASALAPGDLTAGDAPPGAIRGELEAAVFVPDQGVAVVVQRDGDLPKAWSWAPGAEPERLEGPVPEDPWITSSGALRSRRDLKPLGAKDGVVYTGDVMVVRGRRDVSVLSRDDGARLDAWGKVDRAFPLPEGGGIVYETGASSLPKIRICEGGDCESHGLSVGWRHDASSVAFDAAGELLAACREGEVVLFVLGELRGLYLGKLEVPGGCADVRWLPGGELMVQGEAGVSLWRVSPARGGEGA